LAIKKYKPTSPGRRFMSASAFDEITKDSPEKALLEPKHAWAGRNANGRITVRHRGGGHKRMYRLIDFKRDKTGVPAKVAAIEYDPNRTARIALLHYLDGEKRYILAPVGLNVGDMVISGPTADIKPGNALPISVIPVGTVIHNIEFRSNSGGRIARTAGASAQLVAKESEYAHIRMPSGELRLVRQDCMATVGQVGNIEHENIVIGKAGRSRWLGRRPSNRGVAMNPVDHPHGGGEGRSPIGRAPVTPWGQPALGHRTRKHKPSDRLIVKRRE